MDLLPLQSGHEFNHLKIQTLLGQGAMGAVYLASHMILKVPVVVKVMKAGGSGLGFINEARLAARVTSSHVVSVLDAGCVDGQHYIVQSYIDGIDFAELLEVGAKARLNIPATILCQMLREIALGLHAIHQAGIVHRDIKPHNLFFNGFGNSMIGDFGIAFDRSIGLDSRTVTGTPYYMAPEMWEAEHDVDRRADIYSFGATIHHMVTGSPPFLAKTTQGLMKAHLLDPYQIPPREDPGQAYLLALAAQMLRKDPSRRLKTARLAADSLSTIAADPSVTVIHESLCQIGELCIAVVAGDLAAAEADVLVSAANTHLHMSVGVARALRAAGGESIYQEAKAHGSANLGDVIWTKAGSLKAKYIAHAVSAWDGAVCIQRCVLRILLEAEARQVRRVAFPALGAGVGRVPMSLVATLMLEASRNFARFCPNYVKEIQIVIHSDDSSDLKQWQDVLQSM
jgi:O-acetyl-ADP-ribose deacetylase (regulator of RNase III)